MCICISNLLARLSSKLACSSGVHSKEIPELCCNTGAFSCWWEFPLTGDPVHYMDSLYQFTTTYMQITIPKTKTNPLLDNQNPQRKPQNLFYIDQHPLHMYISFYERESNRHCNSFLLTHPLHVNSVNKSSRLNSIKKNVHYMVKQITKFLPILYNWHYIHKSSKPPRQIKPLIHIFTTNPIKIIHIKFKASQK